uniref:Uncharacterized protein n=1 Tax=viral metagenome TaxID=1070528 RepID=A0A6M3LNI4_9ZZZZ
MTENLPAKANPAQLVETALLVGDLSKMNEEQRISYYQRVCESLGLNPYTRPFEYLELDGKLVLYARRDCTDQLRSTRKVNVNITSRETTEGLYVVTARATLPDGRTDESIGAVPITKEDGEWSTAQSGKRYFKGNGNWLPIRGDALANAFMKAETKAKRRATLSICGLGWLDETEVETIPGAQVFAAGNVTAPDRTIVESPQPAQAEPPTAPITTIDRFELLRTFGALVVRGKRLGLTGFPEVSSTMPAEQIGVAIENVRVLVEAAEARKGK